MTGRCDSNPAQYERNRRFGHLVHVLTRSSGGAKLPSVGLCLNASKAESRLVMATIPLGLLFCSGSDSLRTPSRSGELCCLAQSAGQLSSSSTWQSGGPKSSVDDLCAGRGVVLGRAATILRSIETQPFWLDDLSCQLDKSSKLLGLKGNNELFVEFVVAFFIWLCREWSPSLCMSHLDLSDIWVLENLPPQAKFALSSKLCLFYLVQYFNLLTYVWQSLMFSPASDFAIFIWTHPLPNLNFFGFTT